jgi:amino acid transporter
LAANAVNTTIGSGIFVFPSVMASILGPAAIVAYLICGLAMGLVMVSFVEAGTVVHRSGGPVAYVERAFGRFAGFMTWILYSFGIAVLAMAAVSNVLLDIFSSRVPGINQGMARLVALALLIGILAVVNIIGIRQGMGLAVALTVAKLVPLLFVIVAGAAAIQWEELRWPHWPPVEKVGEASLMLFFAFQGVELALTPSGEVRDPEKDLPIAIMGASIVIVFLFVAVQVVSQGVLGGELTRQGAAPLAGVAGKVAGPAGRDFVLAGAGISILGALAGAMTGTPRAFFLLAQDGMLPGVLAKVHPRFRTPHVAIVAVAVLVFLFAATGAFRPLAILVSVSTLCVYLLVCLGALRLRYTLKESEARFRAPGGPVIGILGVAAVLWLLAQSSWAEIRAVFIALTIGAVYYLVFPIIASTGRASSE